MVPLTLKLLGSFLIDTPRKIIDLLTCILSDNVVIGVFVTVRFLPTFKLLGNDLHASQLIIVRSCLTFSESGNDSILHSPIKIEPLTLKLFDIFFR